MLRNVYEKWIHIYLKLEQLWTDMIAYNTRYKKYKKRGITDCKNEPNTYLKFIFSKRVYIISTR